MTSEEVRRRGIEALSHELGPVGTIRFLQQFETGSGDYTKDRHKSLPDDVQAIVDEIARERTETTDASR